MKLLTRDDTDHNTTYITLDDFQKAEAAWSVTYLENEKLERENERLREELEINTQEIDSYGEPGSNFRICSYCKSESGAGMLDKGIPHEPGCILSNVPSDLSLLAFGMVPAREAESAGTMPKVPQGQGLGRLACSHFWFVLGTCHLNLSSPSQLDVIALRLRGSTKPTSSRVRFILA